jgi:7-cyano-7-deazaguanine reductase
MENTILGQNSIIPLQYDPAILSPISRLDSRIKNGLNEFYDFHGRDFWTSYETSWLNDVGIPQNKILNISYDCNSKYFVESKSLKLYLYSLNNKKFKSLDTLRDLIKDDLEKALKTEVDVDLDMLPRSISDSSASIDEEYLEKMDSYPNSQVIQPGEKENTSEYLSCSLFRSLCPVTSQPDWATIYISYNGNSIQHDGLLRYLLSYRNHQAFHEECVERIFTDLLKRCRLKDLSVRANFLRRGGIEINPIRTTPNFNIEITRDIRQ